MKQQGEKGRRVARWQSGRGGRVVRWEGGRFLVFFKGGGCRVSPRFHLFVSVSQGKEWTGWIQYFLAWQQGWEDSLLIFCKLLKM